MIRALILEDDTQQAELLKAMVEASSSADMIDMVSIVGPDDPDLPIAVHAADILLADIRLEHNQESGQTGIDVVERLLPEGSSTQVICVSGYLEYASDVYRTDHVWFLDKPVSPEMLDRALARAIENLGRLSRRPLVVRSHGALVQIAPQRIVYIESDRRKAFIHERTGVTETYARLSDLEEELPSFFVRCHKSFLVNMNHIAELKPQEVILLDGEHLPVSQRCRKAVRDAFLAHVSRAV